MEQSKNYPIGDDFSHVYNLLWRKPRHSQQAPCFLQQPHRANRQVIHITKDGDFGNEHADLQKMFVWFCMHVISCSPPARWGWLDLSELFFFSSSFSSSFFSSSSFSSTTSASTSMSTSALPTLRQALRQLPHAVATAGPQLQGSERTRHRWTSTWDLPSSVSTAGPQPGTLGTQWARLDLNLGPSELSEHRWTSTWDPPSSVSTAGPQRPDRMPEDEDMPDRMPEDMPDRMPEGMPDRMSDRMPEGMPEGMPDKVPECFSR